MAGGYLRTNWRQTTSGVKANAIGQGWQLGSFASGPGVNFPNGGFIMGSINGSTDSATFGPSAATAPYFKIEAISAMNLFYGSNGGGCPLIGGTSGFKIVPFNANFIGSQQVSISAMYIWASVTANDSTIRFNIAGSAYSTGTSVNIQAHFVWEGFIVSTP